MIAVISDTHLPRGSRGIPGPCRRLLGQAALIVHAGDFTCSETLDDLEALGQVAAVFGNMDEPALRERLPPRATVEAEGSRIGLVHDAGPAAGRHERLETWFPVCDLVVYGHSHIPELTRRRETWIVNPGSPTQRRRAPSHTMVIVREGVPEIVNLDERV